MAWSLIDHAIIGDPTGVSATIAVTINSTGADFLAVFVAAGDVTPTVSDLQGGGSNSWTSLTLQNSFNRISWLWYAWNPTHVGAAHVITLTANGASRDSLSVQAWSGSQTSSDPFDVQNGATANGPGSLQTGSVATASGELIISGYAGFNDSVPTIDSSFTKLDFIDTGAGNPHNALATAYKLQTGASENPTWTVAGGVPMAVTIATFKGSGGGGGFFGSSLMAIQAGRGNL